MAWLSPSVLSKKRLRDNDHKTDRPLDRTPATRRGSGARTRNKDPVRGHKQTMKQTPMLKSATGVLTPWSNPHYAWVWHQVIEK
jgi:hypothetical protein